MTRKACEHIPQPVECEAAHDSYGTVEEQLSELVRTGSAIPTGPALMPAFPRPSYTVPLIPEPIKRDASLSQLRTREAELIELQKKYESLVATLHTEHDEITKQLPLIKDDLSRQTQFAAVRQSQYSALLNEGRAAYKASTDVSERLGIQCAGKYWAYCGAVRQRASLDPSIQEPIVTALEQFRTVYLQRTQGLTQLAMRQETVSEVTKVKGLLRNRTPATAGHGCFL